MHPMQRFGRTWPWWLVLTIISFVVAIGGVAIGFGSLVASSDNTTQIGHAFAGMFASAGIGAVLGNIFFTVFLIAMLVRIIDFIASLARKPTA